MFEKAKWISARFCETKSAAPLFRKAFTVNKKAESAVLSACGLGLAVYFINGKRVTEDVMITPFTKYDTTVLYSQFNVTELLNTGENVIGVVLGNGCYCVDYPRWDMYVPSWQHHPKLILTLSVKFADGSIICVKSDTSWKVSESCIIYNQTKRGETRDARLEKLGWNDVGFNDSDWGNAFICRSPGGVLKKSELPPIRITDVFPAVKISENIYDIGQNISGWVRFSGSAPKGHKTEIKYAECTDKNGKPDYDKLNTIIGAVTHTDTYIFKGEGSEIFEPNFAYHGFRYFEVVNPPDNFKAEGRFVHTDLKQVGDFSCSNDVLNKLHIMTRMSTLSNVQGIVTDCPQREQNGWTGDASVSADQMLMNFEMRQVYFKWLGDIFDHQRPSGQIPAIAPTGGWGYNWGTGPSFDGFVIRCPYLICKYTNDSRAIVKYWNNMHLYMQYLESMSEDYILDFGIGDWRSPPGTGETPRSLVDTSHYHSLAKLMAECAKIIGKPHEKYERLAEKIKAAYRERFVSGGNVNTPAAMALTIYHDLLNTDEIQINVRRLNNLVKENGYHIACGIFGTKALFNVLSDNGFADTVYKMITVPGMPGYAHWVNSGMTTLCECWDMSESLNHHMFSEVDMWFYKYLAGINISFGKAVIRPCFLKELSYVKAHCRGIYVEWNKSEITVKSDLPFVLKLNGEEYSKSGTRKIRKEEWI